MTSPKTIQTERLSLRWFVPGDEDILLAVWNDPDFVRNVGDRGIRTVEQASEALAAGPLKLYTDHGYGPYRVALPETDEPIGVCGLFKRDFLDEPDIGFALLPKYCGNGFAYEAAIAVLNHARDGLGMGRVTAIVSPTNKPSIGLIEKLGLHFEDTVATPDNHNVSLYAIDWKKGSANVT
jgi:ribosomal-protein-alanine N-acetyltransferase